MTCAVVLRGGQEPHVVVAAQRPHQIRDELLGRPAAQPTGFLRDKHVRTANRRCDGPMARKTANGRANRDVRFVERHHRFVRRETGTPRRRATGRVGSKVSDG